jgi:hypothetical protein
MMRIDKDLLKESFYEAIEVIRTNLYEGLPVIICIIIILTAIAILLFILFIAVTQHLFWLLCFIVPLLVSVLFILQVMVIWAEKRI